MKRIIEHELVNWVDGMKIAKTHLQQTENFFIDSLCDILSTKITSYNYGLLPAEDGVQSNEFTINEDTAHHAEIVLTRCHAITPGGYIISYDPVDNFMFYNIPLDMAKSEDEKGEKGGRATSNRDINKWDVILSVNPFKREPTGEPDAEENPPRHPNAMPAYQLSVLPAGQVNPDSFGLYHLVIGRIVYNGQRFEVDSSFIPPCTSMHSHTALINYQREFSEYMTSIETSSQNIISKVQNVQKVSSLAVNIDSICREIMRYISSIYFEYRNLGKYAEPVRIVNYCSSLAHICITAMSFLSKTQKEGMLQYFCSWKSMTPGQFEDILADAAGVIYSHNDIRESMVKIETFLREFSDLWNTLRQLEYIGQVKDNVVVTVKSAQQDITATSWSVID